MKSIAILGSTGSIGVSTLKLVRSFPDRFRARGLVAGRNFERLAEQILEFSPEWVSIGKKEDIPRLQTLLGKQKTEIVWGEEGAKSIATAPEVDVVIAAVEPVVDRIHPALELDGDSWRARRRDRHFALQDSILRSA